MTQHTVGGSRTGGVMGGALARIAGLAVGLAITAAAHGQVKPAAAMLRFPDVSKDQITFVYGNDIWVVPKAGGAATPLSSPSGAELFPRFSNDGKTIAFVGNYDGNRDVYTMPVAGGPPTRVTHHPGGESLADWAPDNRLLFVTNGLAGLSRQTQLFSVAATGGMPEQLPVPYAGFGSISADGNWLAYTLHSIDTRTWKRYRGGMATEVWLFNLKDKTSKRITEWEGTDTLPMWVPGRKEADVVYYLSDNGPEHRLNIWSYNVKTGKREQITKHEKNDVRWPGIGPGDNGRGEIVFQLGGELRLLDLSTKKDKVVNVTIPGDRPTVRTRLVDASRFISGVSLSPTGKRVAVEARGEIWSAPAKEGAVRNLSQTEGVFERSPTWSPDGRSIAYFSDAGGEYDLYIRPSDGRPEAIEKKDDKKAADKKDGASQPEAFVAGRGEVRKLTTLGEGFRFQLQWSPDSKKLNFTDQAGRLFLVDAESGDVKEVDTDPWANPLSVSWSQDSRWFTYARADEDNAQGCVWVYNVESGEKTRLTSPMFGASAPVFDRKGDFIYYFTANSVDSPTYSDIDDTFIYVGSQRLVALPLRNDVKNPLLPKGDEEQFKKDKKNDDTLDGKKDGESKKDSKANPEAAGATLAGVWTCTAMGGGENFPPEGVEFKLTLKVENDTVSGDFASAMGNAAIDGGSFDPKTGAFELNFMLDDAKVEVKGVIAKDNPDSVSGSWSHGEASGTFNGSREGAQPAKDGDAAKDSDTKAGDKKDAEKKPDPVKIDFDGIELRGIQVPIQTGSFGGMDVTHDNKIIFTRTRVSGEDEVSGAVKIYGFLDEEPEEKKVTDGAGFELSADGRKILVRRAGKLTVMDAAAGGGKSSDVPTGGMRMSVDPRAEWRQIMEDVYRINRDYFYEPGMHGVDWKGMRDHYMAMIEDCSSREDVAFVIGEFISELNVGHAYVTSPGDVESTPSVNVGLLGCDFKLEKTDAGEGYRISKIYTGGPWDTDSRGPLSAHGVNVKEGEFLLAVNGAPVDVTVDPWAALIDTAGRPTTITVGPRPVIDGEARDVLVKPVASEVLLRYRAWVEAKRKYVEEKSGGTVGYVYVPNTGVNGQDELFRQFFGQMHKSALIIDDRWNGGGQIPTRFIELLNRPVTNYWARRDGKDWQWPARGHQGPKCMLVNGLAGSGGDAFPFYFRQAGLGKLIGTRTWGGLVGISGNPGLIDGGSIAVPTFGFYEKDGTWGIEGHGVDPDIEVIDDPALMVDGGDPQLDKAIELMLEQSREKPYVAPKRPKGPDRSKMGVTDSDK